METQGCRDVPWDVWATMLAHADVETVARCAAASPFWFDLAGQALLLRAQQHLRGLSPDPRSPPLHLFERPSAVAADTHMPRLSLVKCLCLAELRRRGRPGCIATCGLTNAYADILGGLWMWGDVYDQRLRGHIGRPEWAEYPMRVRELSHVAVVGVAAGRYHCLAVASGGAIFSWGWWA